MSLPACCRPSAMPLPDRAGLALLLCLLAGCNQADGSGGVVEDARSTMGGRQSTRSTLVVVKPLVVGPVRDEVVVSAKVAARTSVAIHPKLSALPVTRLCKEEGDSVAEQELLLTLFDTDLRLAAESAEAALAEAAGELERSALAVEEAGQRIKSAERSAVRTAEDLQRLAGLGDLVNRKEVDDARLAADMAADELDLQRFSERSAKVAVDLARSAVRRAEIEHERARTDLDYTRVLSPTAGVVAERFVSEGELVNAGSPMLTIVDTSDLVLQLRVPQDALARLARGQSVDVRPVTGAVAGAAGGDGWFHGTVRTVNPVLDEQTGTVRVTVDLEPAPGLVPGLFCEAHIVTAARSGALMVNKRAVLYENDQPVIFFVTEAEAVETGLPAVPGGDGVTPERASIARKLAFIAGASTPEAMEIVSDLEGAPVPTDLRVVIVGQENLKDGALVKVVEEAF